MSKWYGNLCNRVDENRMFADEIKVGTGMTEYLWSDRHAYEVTKVIDQKHVYVREYDHKHIGEAYTNKWELISNPDRPEMYLTKRGNYWYRTVSLTPERAREILESNDIDARLWASHNGFHLDEIVKDGKKRTTYHRMNVSFGVADYYYDYEF